MPNIYIKDAGAWRNAQNLYVKDAGVWRLIKTGYTKVNGVWQKVWGNTGTISYASGAGYTFVVPPAVYSATFTLVAGGGGAGGADGGYGSYRGNSGQRITVTYAVTPGQTFLIYPGSGGLRGAGGVSGRGGGAAGTNPLGGVYNGGQGGNAGPSGSSGGGGGGGAASVLMDGFGTAIAVAYGGAGAAGSGNSGPTSPYSYNAYRPINSPNGDNHPGDGGGGGGGSGGVVQGKGGWSGGYVNTRGGYSNIPYSNYWGSADIGGAYGQTGTGLVPAGATQIAGGNADRDNDGGNGSMTVSY